jgi:hypothetical protein
MMRCHPNKIDKNIIRESQYIPSMIHTDIRRNLKNILKFRNIIVSLKCRNQEKKIKKIWENQRKIVSLKKTVRDR